MNLSGLVAVIDNGQVVEIRNLGPKPVACKPGKALPLVENRPQLGYGQMYGEPTLAVGTDKVTRNWPVIDAPFIDLPRFAFLFMLEKKLGVDRSKVEDVISKMPSDTPKRLDTRNLALYEIRDQSIFRRDNALFARIATAFGLTDEQVDEAWRQVERLI